MSMSTEGPRSILDYFVPRWYQRFNSTWPGVITTGIYITVTWTWIFTVHPLGRRLRKFISHHISGGFRRSRRLLQAQLGAQRPILAPELQYPLPYHESREIPFTYSPLDPIDAEIRLLYFLPGSLSGELRLCINHVSLHDNPKYAALSYRWGGREPQIPVLINGYTFHVAPNLATALRHLAQAVRQELEMPIWIDAICINQENFAERSQQILLMNEIYSKASKVKVWIGSPDPESELALAQLRAVEGWFGRGMHGWNDTRDSADPNMPYKDSAIDWQREITANDVRLWGDPNKPEESFLDGWQAIKNVFTNPWFTRTWVAQEVSSAQTEHVEIILGRQLQSASLNQTLYLTLFLISLMSKDMRFTQWPRVGPLLNDLEKSLMPAYRLHGIKAGRVSRAYRLRNWFGFALTGLFTGSPQQQERTLWSGEVLTMLQLFRGFEASDPRDKVYAAYILALDPPHPAFDPDYTMSKKQVYCDVVRAFLRYQQDLTILAHTAPDQSIPSWIPDWTLQLEAFTLSTMLDKDGRCIYRAAGDSLPIWDIDGEGNTLTLSGIYVDTISCIGTELCMDTWQARASGYKDMRTLPHILWTIFKPFLSTHHPQTNEPMMQAFLRTLLMDRKPHEMQSISDLPWHGSPWSVKWAKLLGLLVFVDLNEKSPFTKTDPVESLYKHIAFLSRFEQGARSGPAFSRGAAAEWDDTIRVEETLERGEEEEGGGGAKRITLAVHTKPALQPAPPPTDPKTPQPTRTPAPPPPPSHQSVTMFESTSRRRFAVTRSGCIGLVPRTAEVDDTIVVFCGGAVPFVLRMESRKETEKGEVREEIKEKGEEEKEEEEKEEEEKKEEEKGEEEKGEEEKEEEEKEMKEGKEAGKEKEQDRYRLVGECYLHGYMDGEAMQRAGATVEEWMLV